jgi:hypothetical protein
MLTLSPLCKPSTLTPNKKLLSGVAMACLLVGATLCAAGQSAAPSGVSSSEDKPDAPTLTASAETPAFFTAKPQNGPYARPMTASPDGYDFHHYTFAFGGGFDIPAGQTSKYQTPGFNVKIAGGYNLNRMLGAQVEYNYDHFGIPQAQLNRVKEPNGDVHLWSIGIDPFINIPTRGKVQPYVIGGVGFYRKVTEFTEPYASCYYYCYSASAIVAHFSNNAFGANGGIGFNFRASRWNDVKFFAEARYVWVNNSQSSNSASDGYSPANDRTGYFPATFGVRF